VKKTQDEPVKGIYNLSTMIWRRNNSKSPTTQSVRQDSLLYERFPVHQWLKEIMGYDSPSLNVKNKNMSLHIFCEIL